MRILFFITKSEAGGAQTHVADLTAWLIQHGHTVWVMSTTGGWLEDETKRAGATFIPNRSLGNTANPFRLFSTAQTLKKATHDLAPDLVTCHSTMAGLIGRFVLRNAIPTVYTAHGWSFTLGAPLSRRLVMPFFERLAAKFCMRIICVSKQDKQLAIARHIAPETKLVVIHNGVKVPANDQGYAPLFASPRSDQSCPMIVHDWSLDSSRNQPKPTRSSQKIELLFVGRLASPKDPFLLLHALLSLPQKQQTNIHLTIVGDGPQKPHLVENITRYGLSSVVSLVGRRTRAEIFELLGRSDIFILPTRYEGFPYTILEAMAAGIPVIASNVGGINEAVGTDAGIVVPPNDQVTLTSAINHLVTDPVLRARLGKAAFSKAQKLFSIEQMCTRTLAIYQEIC